MAVEKPQFEPRVDIPAIYNAQGTSASCQNSFESACDVTAFDAVKQRREADAAANEINLAQLQLNGEAAKNAGVQTDARGASDSSYREAEAEKQRKKNAEAVETAAILNAMHNHLEELYHARDQANNDLDRIRESQDALKKLRDLHADVALDPDNPIHADLMKKAGITREDLMSDPTGAFDRQAKFWDKKARNKIREIEDINRDIKKAEEVSKKPPEEQREYLKSVKGNELHQTAALADIDADTLDSALEEHGFSENEIKIRKIAESDGLFNGGEFAPPAEKSENTTERSFASTLELGDPPPSINLVAEFDTAVSVPTLAESVTVLDLDNKFGM